MSNNIDKKIEEALLLIEKEGTESKISITNICKMVNISRQSLYNRPDLVNKIKDINKKNRCGCHLLIRELKEENKKLKEDILIIQKNKFQF